MSDSDIEQFVPRNGGTGVLKDDMRDVAEEVCPGISDEGFEAMWAGYCAMVARVNNPRRRQGTDVRRCGPVLFDPYQPLRRGSRHGQTP